MRPYRFHPYSFTFRFGVDALPTRSGTAIDDLAVDRANSASVSSPLHAQSAVVYVSAPPVFFIWPWTVPHSSRRAYGMSSRERVPHRTLRYSVTPAGKSVFIELKLADPGSRKLWILEDRASGRVACALCSSANIARATVDGCTRRGSGSCDT